MESKDLLKNQLQALIKTYSDKYGFIDYRNTWHLGCIISEMAEEAMLGLEKGQIQKSMFTTLAIIEVLADQVNNVDDSDGQIAHCIDKAFIILDTLTGLDLNKAQHEELFDSLLAFFEKDMLKEWHWYFNTIELDIKLIKTNQEKEIIKSVLDRIKPNGKSRDWYYEKAQELMQELND